MGCVNQWDALQLHPIGYCGHMFVDKQREQHFQSHSAQMKGTSELQTVSVMYLA